MKLPPFHHLGVPDDQGRLRFGAGHRQAVERARQHLFEDHRFLLKSLRSKHGGALLRRCAHFGLRLIFGDQIGMR